MSNTRHATGLANDEFDLDAYEAEAERKPFTFKLGGESYELPHTEAIEWHQLENLNGPDLVKLALGDQFARFDKHSLTAGGYKELQRRWFAHSGVSLGESSASSDSSKSTARR